MGFGTLLVVALALPGNSARARARVRMSEPASKPEGTNPIAAAIMERGFPRGSRVKFGPFTAKVDAESIPSESERRRLIEADTADLTVIDKAERERRTRLVAQRILDKVNAFNNYKESIITVFALTFLFIVFAELLIGGLPLSLCT